MKTSKSFDFVALSATIATSEGLVAELTASECYELLNSAEGTSEEYRGGTYYYAENALLKVATSERQGYIFKVVRGETKRTERKERVGNKLVTIIEEEETPLTITLVAECQVVEDTLMWS